MSFFKRYKLLLQNFSYMVILRVLTLILPLVTFPYLIKTLGSEKYGLVMWAWAISQFFIVWVKFGFDNLGVKLISENRENKQKLSQIFSTINYIKLLLFALCSIVFFIMLFGFEKIAVNKTLFLYFYIFIFFEGMFPVWYFQGIENMKVMSILVALIKLLFALLVFIFVHQQSDFLFVPMLYTIGSIIASGIAYFLILRKDKIYFCKVKLKPIIPLVKESFYIFLTTIGNITQSSLTIILIERYLGLSSVAFFDLSIKIINILLTPFHIISQVLYPHIAKTKDMGLIKKVLILITFISFMVAIIFSLNATWISSLVNYEIQTELSGIMKILVFIVPLGALSSLLSMVLIVNKQTPWLLYSILVAMFVYMSDVSYMYFTEFSTSGFILLILLFFISEFLVRMTRIVYIFKQRE